VLHATRASAALARVPTQTTVLQKTIIEKFEKHADVGYAFILLTPDEVSYLVAEEKIADEDRKKELRARPNVIFEFELAAAGYSVKL
jgi:predicted nucleotide-binding protein